MKGADYAPAAGHLIWTDFDPTLGREQAGRRPALVVSDASFIANTGLAVVCPITPRARPFPTGAVIPAGLPIADEILTSHVRSIDTQARPIRYTVVAVLPEVAQYVRAILFSSLTSESERLAWNYQGQVRKAFFSEEKNQKTFIPGARGKIPATASNMGEAEREKSFASRRAGFRLFFRNEDLLYPIPPKARYLISR